MGCENSNEITNLNKTDPTNRVMTINQNNLLSPQNNSQSQNNIFNKRRGSKVMLLRKSITDRYKNPIQENRQNSLSKKENQEENSEESQKLKLRRKSVKKNYSKLFKNNVQSPDNLYLRNTNFNQFNQKLTRKKSTPIHFNNSAKDLRKLSNSNSIRLKSENEPMTLKDEFVKRNNLKRNTEILDNRDNKKRKSFKLRNNSNNFEFRNLSTNNFYSIQKDFMEPISIRNSQKKMSYLPGINNKYNLDYNSNNENNNSFQKKKNIVRLSRKASILEQDNLNENDKLNGNTPFKFFKKEKVSQKRKSVIVPRKYVNLMKNYDGRKMSKQLNNISEVNVLSHLFKENKQFHKLNKELFYDIENLINYNEDIYKRIMFVICRNYNFYKNPNEDPNYEENIKISIINKIPFNDWNIEPLKTFKENIEKLFEEEKYKDYSYLNFDIKFQEYEKMPKNLKLPLIKFYPKFNQCEDISFEFNKYSNVITIFFFDDSEDSINALKIISDFYNNNLSMFHFIPIYCKHINESEESLKIYNHIKTNYINLCDNELYFILNKQSQIFENYFSYKEEEKITPLIYIIDKNFYIRSITNINNFNLSMIKNIKEKIEKQTYIEQVNSLIEIFEAQKSQNNIYQSRLFFRKVELCQFESENQKIYKIKKFYEGLTGFIYGNSKMISEIQNSIDINFINVSQFQKDNLSRNYNSNNSNDKNLNLIIKNEINNFSKKLGLNLDNYDNVLTKVIDFYNIYNKNFPNEKFKNHIEKKINVEIPLKTEAFQKEIQFILTNSLSTSFNNSNININSISCLPLLNQEFPSEFELINPKKKYFKEKIQIINPNELNFIIIIHYSDNYLFKCEINSRINKLKFYLDDINILVIFKGEIEQYNSIIEDLTSISNNNIPNYILESDNKIFPFYIQKTEKKNDNTFYAYLIDNEGKIIYTGNLTDIIQLERLIKNNNDDLENDNIQISDYLIKKITLKEINEIIEKFENLIQKEFDKISNTLYYRPCIKFFYDKKIKSKSGNEKIENIIIYIVIKQRHKNLFISKNEIKDFFDSLKKNYGALIIIIPLECEKIQIPTKCQKCNKNLLNEIPHFYNQEENISFCENCEKNIEYNSHLIYIKSNLIDKEIISDLFNSNFSINENLSQEVPNNCLICEKKLDIIFYISLTQFNFKIGYSPICFCQNCFEKIDKNQIESFTEIENNTVNEFCIHSNNLILRKVIIT